MEKNDKLAINYDLTIYIDQQMTDKAQYRRQKSIDISYETLSFYPQLSVLLSYASVITSQIIISISVIHTD